tara:strand:+ start:426 stop:656 length:231 start_codon:yes stop_codon:yes gene_type:complete
MPEMVNSFSESSVVKVVASPLQVTHIFRAMEAARPTPPNMALLNLSRNLFISSLLLLGVAMLFASFAEGGLGTVAL